MFREPHRPRVAFNGRLPSVAGIAWVGNPGLVKIWDLDTKELRLTLGHSQSVLAVDHSSDGRFIASGCVDRTIRIWNAATGDEIFVLPHNWIPDKLQYSPDGKLLATSGRLEAEVKFWDVETWIERATFEAKDCWIRGFAWSPNTQHLAVACSPAKGNWQMPGSMRLWDVANEPERLSVHERKVWSGENHPSDVAFSPNGYYIADDRTPILGTRHNKRHQ